MPGMHQKKWLGHSDCDPSSVSYVVMVKSSVDISRNIWPFSKYMNFTFFILVNYYFGFSKCEEDENAPFKNSFSPLCILKKVSKRDRPPVKSPN